jgi:hypothetical protein
MAERGPSVERDELYASSLRELFRYRKAGRTRIYNLRVVSEEQVELWVVSEEGAEVKRSRKLVQFANPDDAESFLQDVERELRAGGWSKG